MSELTVLPEQLHLMSVSQLAALAPVQLAEVHRNLDELAAWLKQARARFDAALEVRFGEQARATRAELAKDFGIVHLREGALHVTIDVPKRVSWDQRQLADIAHRITAAGERVDDYLDVEYSVSEARFTHWPTSLREQFEPARTVKPGKPSFRLSLDSEI